MKHSAFRLLCVLGVVSGCSLFLGFDPEGLPCDASGKCRPGYQCVEDKCARVSTACGDCPEGYRCENDACAPASCASYRCPVGKVCSDSAGFPECLTPVAPDLAHPCRSDLECEAGGVTRLCYFGAIQLRSGGLRPGVCLERCGDGGTSCATVGATCETFSFGRDVDGARLCVTPGLVRGCKSDKDCAPSAETPSCTVFEHVEHGPIALCDKPLESGALTGEACGPSPSNQRLCGNGLCIPPNPGPGQTAVCGALCDDDTCAAGSSCALVETRVLSAVRHLPMCVSEVSACRSCSSDNACQADAPRCSELSAGDSRCLTACSPTTGLSPQCPSGTECRTLDAGLRCVPVGGSCM